ncbi:MAG: transglycosylase SLT domain-containing protein [Synechococcales bacterium]|nr:transglycosylase SLT domain-containing protein [Synechococcales bacterium]
MWKRWNQKKLLGPILIGLGATSFLVGGLVSLTTKPGDGSSPIANFTQLSPFGNKPQPPERTGMPTPMVSPVVSQPPKQRAETLRKVAKTSSPSLDRSRARYVLASDLVSEGRGQEALEQLQDLEQDYPVLAAQILLKRAQAQEAIDQKKEAVETCQKLVQQYGQDPATAEALHLLGKQNPKYWDQLLQQFPAHPRAIEVAKTQLAKNPKQLPLLLLLARYDLESKDYPDRMEKLVKEFGSQLQPADWEAIAFGLWENQKYDKAAAAYARSPQTALTTYRAARGLHLSSKPGARQRYEAVVKNYAGSPEAGLALTRLAQLAEKPQEKIAYLDQVIPAYPDRAPQALKEKAEALEKSGSGETATQIRQTLLDQFSSSEAAAELRWEVAQQYRKSNNIPLAKQWTEAIATANPKSEIAAKAGFWSGKWAMQLGQKDQAVMSFQRVLKDHPETYYAWRSATLLGWNVGDFNNVRQLTPTVKRPKVRTELTAGSPALQELYHIGQDWDAWSYWQVEFRNRVQPSMEEQFTDGVMRLGVGDNLDGIFMVSNLRDRDKPEDQQKYQSLRKNPSYWHALYPFPYMERIEAWAKDRQLNPMLVTALIRQESRFEAKIESSAGALGLMQVMPDTAKYIASQIKLKEYKLENPEDNIKLGTWYLDYTHEEYQGNTMLAVASYNAGPGAVSDWLAKSKTQDPDEFVEAIPYDETRGYVKSVLGNYWNYLRLYNPEISQKVAQVSPDHPNKEFPAQ